MLTNQMALSLFFTLLLFVNIGKCIPLLQAAIIIPIIKDSETSLYTLKIKHRTPLVPVRLALDLGGPDLWLTCDNNYTSSSYTPGSCGSGACWLARALFTCSNCAVNSDLPRPGCNNNTCTRQAIGPETSFHGEVGVDVFNFLSVNSGEEIKTYSTPIIFTCASSNNLNGLPNGVAGIAGLGTTRTSLTSQISERLNHTNKFAICLSKNNGGALFLGADSILMHPIKKLTSYLTYTPLIRQILDTNRNLSQNYYINVTSMKFNGEDVPLNKSLLSIDSSGRGGTKISTMVPYTMLQSSIYKTLIDTVAKTMFGGVQSYIVAPVKPFGLCYDVRHFGWTKVIGPTAFPQMKLVLEDGVVWTLFNGNLFKRMGDAMCLAYVDGGSTSGKASIVIGLHQIEDNLLEFDLEKLRFGFSSSFLPTTCGNFMHN